MYAYLRVPVAPAICALALLTEFLPVTPTSKTRAEGFNSDVFQPKNIANFVTLSVLKLFYEKQWVNGCIMTC